MWEEIKLLVGIYIDNMCLMIALILAQILLFILTLLKYFIIGTKNLLCWLFHFTLVQLLGDERQSFLAGRFYQKTLVKAYLILLALTFLVTHFDGEWTVNLLYYNVVATEPAPGANRSLLNFAPVRPEDFYYEYLRSPYNLAPPFSYAGDESLLIEDTIHQMITNACYHQNQTAAVAETYQSTSTSFKYTFTSFLTESLQSIMVYFTKKASPSLMFVINQPASISPFWQHATNLSRAAVQTANSFEVSNRISSYFTTLELVIAGNANEVVKEHLNYYGSNFAWIFAIVTIAHLSSVWLMKYLQQKKATFFGTAVDPLQTMFPNGQPATHPLMTESLLQLLYYFELLDRIKRMKLALLPNSSPKDSCERFSRWLFEQNGLLAARGVLNLHFDDQRRRRCRRWLRNTLRPTIFLLNAFTLCLLRHFDDVFPLIAVLLTNEYLDGTVFYGRYQTLGWDIFTGSPERRQSSKTPLDYIFPDLVKCQFNSRSIEGRQILGLLSSVNKLELASEHPNLSLAHIAHTSAINAYFQLNINVFYRSFFTSLWFFHALLIAFFSFRLVGKFVVEAVPILRKAAIIARMRGKKGFCHPLARRIKSRSITVQKYLIVDSMLFTHQGYYVEQVMVDLLGSRAFDEWLTAAGVRHFDYYFDYQDDFFDPQFDGEGAYFDEDVGVIVHHLNHQAFQVIPYVVHGQTYYFFRHMR